MHILPHGFTRIRHYGLLSSTVKRKYLKKVQDYLSKNGIKYIDGTKYFKDLNENELWVSKHDTHANERAHKIMGRYLLNFLEKEIF